MATTKDVAKSFATRSGDARANSVFTANGGSDIYSYGYHWLLARHEAERVIVNEDKASVTTSKHSTYVRTALREAGYVPTEETVTLDAPLRGFGRDPETHTFRIWTRPA